MIKSISVSAQARMSYSFNPKADLALFIEEYSLNKLPSLSYTDIECDFKLNVGL